MSIGTDRIEDLLTPRGLLHFRNASAAAIGDPRFCDPVIRNGVICRDVARAHDTGYRQLSQLEVDAHLLRTLDEQVSVRQNILHDRSYQKLDTFRTCDRALSCVAIS